MVSVTGETTRTDRSCPPALVGPASGRAPCSLPGAVGLLRSGGGDFFDGTQARLRRKMAELTKGDLSLPILAVGWSSERFDGYNLALRLVALGYKKVYWYRGGRETWEANGLPENPAGVQDW